ncbi:MAG TPA: 1,4-alpha-glucan branching protein GlgB [Clostridia bacterium]|nr:1,4-alpha-glucan branching protein GlgB [Clostridia bacterium]
MKRFDKTQNIAEYLFHEGTNYRSYDFLGAHLEKDGCVFRVWAPNATQVYVTGDFCDWEPDKYLARRITSGGVFECMIPGVKQFDAYKYVIVPKRGEAFLKADPYAFHSETRPGTASKVYSLPGYEWNDENWMASRRAPYKDPVNIYELHLGSWRRYPDGNVMDYQKLAGELIPYIKEMGYTHIELMPISEYPYDKSWGYQVTGYFSPSSRYGTPKELMAFVDACHQANIGVLLDWVPAHFPKDAHGLYEFDGTCCYEYADPIMREHMDWNTRIFDYGKSEVRSFLISSACYWLEQYHMDGLRVDAVASMLYLDYGRKPGEWKPNRFGGNGNLEAAEFVKALNARAFLEFTGIMMIAEESTSWPMVTGPVDKGGLGFNYKWNMGWMNDSLHYMATDPFFRKYEQNKLTFPLTYAFSENYVLPLSHDEVVHGKRSLIGKMPGEYHDQFANLRAYLCYMYAHPGKKLVFMGTELAQFKEWNEDTELDWCLLEFDKHRQHKDFVKQLNRFYRSQPTLWQNDHSWEGFKWISIDDAENNILAFMRMDNAGNKMLVACNFSSLTRVDYKLGVPNRGYYTEIFSSDCAEYGGVGRPNGRCMAKKGELHSFKQHICLTLPAFSTIFLYKPGLKSKSVH